MLEGEAILCFAPDPWDDIWRNRHQIMSLLAAENQVLYVEPRPYLRPVMQGLMQRRIGLKQLLAPRLRSISPGLHVYNPPLYAPLSGRPPLSTLTEALRAASMKAALRKLHMRRPILWLFRPDMADVPGKYGESFLIYHIVDEYTGYADVDRGRAEEIERREQALIARADLVLVTSRALLESKQGINPNTHWVPNGVDYDRFARAALERQDPPDLADLPRPRIGYVGAINDKIDTDLLLALARAIVPMPLVLVGPERPTSDATRQGLEALRREVNVRFIGQVPVERVPAFVAACDVGLLPYRRNAWTQHIHPLKLYEYLAAGLPVISADIPSVHDDADIVRIAPDTESFTQAVRGALDESDPRRRAERQARAAQNTWRARVERISDLIIQTRISKR